MKFWENCENILNLKEIEKKLLDESMKIMEPYCRGGWTFQQFFFQNFATVLKFFKNFPIFSEAYLTWILGINSNFTKK